MDLLQTDDTKDLEQAVDFLHNFEIDFQRQQVIALMNKIEEHNTEMADEVNQAEIVLLEAKENAALKKGQAKLLLDEASDNLGVLQTRVKSLMFSNKHLNRPF